MLTTKMSKEERESALKPIRLYVFLSAAGLPIKREKLEEILEKAGDSQAVLGKELFKYYKAQGSSLKLITAGIAKLSMDYFSSNGTSKISAKSVGQPNIDIQDLELWQKTTGFYSPKVSMEKQLQNF
ncbi:unnamed protein product [Ambrosiozyma monospora]|uniref:Unnamed protein product n=1 Tax=Ambrosiozyma monospora TaxID=43982 RepID=A0A9W6Z602_AMBMO|nr:unnamed protein product [Ambrosiozyma monospora]